jgi:hypothetical protein
MIGRHKNTLTGVGRPSAAIRWAPGVQIHGASRSAGDGRMSWAWTAGRLVKARENEDGSLTITGIGVNRKSS